MRIPPFECTTLQFSGNRYLMLKVLANLLQLIFSFPCSFYKALLTSMLVGYE
jgi:hypothetical protein